MNVHMGGPEPAQPHFHAAQPQPDTDEAPIRPIILIGLARSGTKWTSNIIASHEDVVAVQSPRYGGILETSMFGPLRKKFDLAHPADYVGLIELWSKTEFFRLAGGDKETFYHLDPRPRTALAVFELLMNDLARRHHCGHWVQKASPAGIDAVLDYFTTARIVVVRRNLVDNVRSAVGLQRRRGIARGLVSTTCYRVYEGKLLDRICKRYPAIEVRYEDLEADPERETARLFEQLGLPQPKYASAVSFPRNTSFASEDQRSKIMSRRDATLVRIIAACAGLLPLPIFSAVIAVRGVFRRRRPPSLLTDSFGELEDRLVDQSRGRGGEV